MSPSVLKYVVLLAGLLLVPFQEGFGQCVACRRISEAVERYEEVEEEIEEWVCIGYEAITNENGETVEQAIMELRLLTKFLVRLTHYIENSTDDHTCNLPPEELPEYIPPPQPVEPEVNPWDPYSNIA